MFFENYHIWLYCLGLCVSVILSSELIGHEGSVLRIPCLPERDIPVSSRVSIRWTFNDVFIGLYKDETGFLPDSQKYAVFSLHGYLWVADLVTGQDDGTYECTVVDDDLQETAASVNVTVARFSDVEISSNGIHDYTSGCHDYMGSSLISCSILADRQVTFSWQFESGVAGEHCQNMTENTVESCVPRGEDGMWACSSDITPLEGCYGKLACEVNEHSHLSACVHVRGFSDVEISSNGIYDNTSGCNDYIGSSLISCSILADRQVTFSWQFESGVAGEYCQNKTENTVESCVPRGEDGMWACSSDITPLEGCYGKLACKVNEHSHLSACVHVRGIGDITMTPDSYRFGGPPPVTCSVVAAAPVYFTWIEDSDTCMVSETESSCTPLQDGFTRCSNTLLSVNRCNHYFCCEAHSNTELGHLPSACIHIREGPSTFGLILLFTAFGLAIIIGYCALSINYCWTKRKERKTYNYEGPEPEDTESLEMEPVTDSKTLPSV